MITVMYDKNFYPAFGLSKMQQMLEDINQHRKEAPSKMADAAQKLASVAGKHEKEGDWAIAGGIAQGIGGIGAGIAAAADTQRKNAEIRQRNAQRDAQAAQLYYLANQVNNTSLNLIDIHSALSEWKVSVDENKDTLFKLLSITVKRIHSYRADIDFEMANTSVPFKVDGYLKMRVYTKAGRVDHEEIIPIPVWEKGSNRAVLLNCNIHYSSSSDVKLEFEPYILWKITTDHQLEHYTRAFRVEDLEPGTAKDNFVNDWNLLETTKTKINSEKKKKTRIITFFVFTVIVILIILIVFAINRNN